MLDAFSHPPLSAARLLGRLESALEAVIHAPLVSTSQQVRGLISALDLTAYSFGIGEQLRAPDEVAAGGLEVEVVLAARRVVKVPEELRTSLLSDLEKALAENVPVACMVHLVRTRLWRTDKAAWVSALMEIMMRIEDEEACKAITAVISQHMDIVPDEN